ncbi:UDP-glycosyltransferase 72B1 [Acorus gramineus]|uniref:Glycosyltransferase n=1 Tax=Acorus gramineus TaxID=55184 RepID=A0AAV9AXD4_ACOGR|nr:UDP-glycosyltransferase 72B1 [Acorus gramineus]
MASRIVILSGTGMGHLIPLVEFSGRLVRLGHGLSVTLVTIGPPSAAQKAILDTLPDSITAVSLPPVSLDDLPGDVRPQVATFLTVSRCLPSLRRVLQELTSDDGDGSKTGRLCGLVVDLFGTDAFDVAEEFGVPCYMFFPSSSMSLSLSFHLPELHVSMPCEYKDMVNPVSLPGCIPIYGSDLPDPFQDRTKDAYKWVLHHAPRYRRAKGILLNSFEDLESSSISSLTDTMSKPPVYPIGPLVRKGERASSDDPTGCLKWLDQQPRGSVLYICFGSIGTLGIDQLTELAAGLEMSGQRFLWVVKVPNPKGFVKRTGERGLIVLSWAPQTQVLGHASTGGFMSHCGWNSTLESVVNGVPLIAWPLYAEQKMNAVMLVGDAKIAIRPTVGEDGVVRREEVSRVVRALMEGEEGMGVRGRVKDLQEGAKKALSEGGSSCKALSEVALKLRQNNTNNNNNSVVKGGVGDEMC